MHVREEQMRENMKMGLTKKSALQSKTSDLKRETLGSWMKLWPDLALGGNSPVQESFKHSMMVWPIKQK